MLQEAHGGTFSVAEEQRRSPSDIRPSVQMANGGTFCGAEKSHIRYQSGDLLMLPETVRIAS